MDSISAYAIGDAARRSGAKHRVFDWNKAAEMIRDHKPNVAVAGLQNDMEYTGGEIITDGKPNIEDYTYLASNWATPVLVLDNGSEIDCWMYEDESPGWDAHTKWPESALKILTDEASNK
jgi:hypothetical protein